VGKNSKTERKNEGWRHGTTTGMRQIDRKTLKKYIIITESPRP